MFYRQASDQYVIAGVAFTVNGTQYPANWLNYATLEEKAELGLVEVTNANSPEDDRFYWVSSTLNGAVRTYTNTPKNLDELKKQWKNKTNNTCYVMLLPNDWMVTKQVETGEPMPVAWNTWRASMRTTASNACKDIDAAADIPALKLAIVIDWPHDPDYVPPVVVVP